MSQGLAGYIIRRLLWAVPVIFAVSIILFVVLRLAPVDPIDSLLGIRYDEEIADRLRQKYGYDQPIHIQYIKYFQNLFQGDLGVSTRRLDFSVEEVVIPKVKVSAPMGAMALVLAYALGIPIGIYAAARRGTFRDPLTIGSWLFIDAIPIFVIAVWAMWFLALKVSLINLSFEGVFHENIILPVLLMSFPGVAGVARFMRASMVQVIYEDYVRTARAKGLRERTVVISHIARNAFLPMITSIGLSLPAIFTGSLFIELMFGIPGIAREMLEAIFVPDYDVVIGFGLFTFSLFVLANILIDITYGFIDPRVRVEAERGG
ncbi:MAG: ABC transporter permease [Dehalococcoidia bacterium]|nr:ABC transporter permease [Dehalococcoidia bacterium]MYI85972.1 ABC transporter permease [Dehalococcoidia bacterium]